MVRPEHSSNKNDWNTPPKLYKDLDKQFKFTIDAAANHKNHLHHNYWTEELDALSQEWAGHRIFCNPPYGRGQKNCPGFINKLIDNLNSIPVAVFLIAARTSNSEWEKIFNIFLNAEVIKPRVRCYGDYCFNGFEGYLDGGEFSVLFANERIKFFENGVESSQGAPFPSALLIWERSYG